jgi:hypothetical protein
MNYNKKIAACVGTAVGLVGVSALVAFNPLLRGETSKENQANPITQPVAQVQTFMDTNNVYVPKRDTSRLALSVKVTPELAGVELQGVLDKNGLMCKFEMTRAENIGSLNFQIYQKETQQTTNPVAHFLCKTNDTVDFSLTIDEEGNIVAMETNRAIEESVTMPSYKSSAQKFLGSREHPWYKTTLMMVGAHYAQVPGQADPQAINCRVTSPIGVEESSITRQGADPEWEKPDPHAGFVVHPSFPLDPY